MGFKFQKKILKNGMTLLFEKRDVPVVSIAFAVRAGGINERPEEKGISHFIEHMLYKGTPTRNSKKIADEIERNGGEMNGMTTETLTAFWCKMPSQHLNVALDVLSDMVKNPLFDEKELDKERKVIFEEIKMIQDSPMRYVLHDLGKVLYKKNFLDIIGTVETLNKMDKKIIFNKFKEIYTPNNLILCVVGDADFEKLIKFAEKNFGENKANIPELTCETINREEIKKRKGVGQANLVFAYHVPLASDKKSYAANVLSVLMGEGMSSRLFSEIREKRNLAYAVKGGSEITKFFAYNFVYVGTSKENVEEVKKLIIEEFKKVAGELEEKELNEVKEQLLGNYQISMEDSQNQMMNLISYEMDGDAKKFYEFEKNIKDVKLEDVKELAKNASEKFGFFALVPE